MSADKKIEAILEYLKLNAKVFSEKLGYERPQIIYDIQKGKTKRISEELANKIVSVFPAISKAWLLADEGDMINIGVTQVSHGDNSPNLNGNVNNLEQSSSLLGKALDEISAMRKALTDALTVNQRNTDRLLSIIENMNR